MKETEQITGQEPHKLPFTEISPCERPNFQSRPKGTKFLVSLEHPEFLFTLSQDSLY